MKDALKAEVDSRDKLCFSALIWGYSETLGLLFWPLLEHCYLKWHLVRNPRFKPIYGLINHGLSSLIPQAPFAPLSQKHCLRKGARGRGTSVPTFLVDCAENKGD